MNPTRLPKMPRRTFMAMIAGGLLASPLAAQAQQAGKVWRVGLLAPGPAPLLMNPFVSAMREYGWLERRDFILESRYTGANAQRAEALANDLISEMKVDLILTINTANAQAARRASRVVPIVMLTSGYPVEAGLAKSLARPGGNVTGLSAYAGGGLFTKYVQFLKDLLPSLKSFAVFWDYVPPGFVKEEVEVSLGEMKRAASTLGVAVRVFEIGTRDDLERAIRGLGRERVDALFVTNGPIQRQDETAAKIIDFAIKQQLPTMTDVAGNVFAAGCLMTYSASVPELGRRGAALVDRILRGAKPGDLPIEQPTRFELVINLKTAKALGLTIPQSLLGRADEVIQ